MTPTSGQDSGTPAPNAQEVAAQMTAVTDYVRQCDMRVRRGDIMDLGGLDRTVALICADIAVLPRHEALAMEDRMQALVTALDELAAAMREQKEAADAAPAPAPGRGL